MFIVPTRRVELASLVAMMLELEIGRRPRARVYVRLEGS